MLSRCKWVHSLSIQFSLSSNNNSKSSSLRSIKFILLLAWGGVDQSTMNSFLIRATAKSAMKIWWRDSRWLAIPVHFLHQPISTSKTIVDSEKDHVNLPTLHSTVILLNLFLITFVDAFNQSTNGMASVNVAHFKESSNSNSPSNRIERSGSYKWSRDFI